jgi:Zn-dependent protease
VDRGDGRLPRVDLVPILLGFAVFLVSLSVHESAHAWTAWRLGDWTGKALGRVSLNPMRHIDPIGTIALPLLLYYSTHGRFMFGYAKPVPYNPFALKNPALGSALVAGAGPTSNLLLAAAAALFLGLVSAHGLIHETLGQDVLVRLVEINVFLGLFNLFPVPPLDGFTVVSGLLPRAVSRGWSKLELLGPALFVVLLVTGAINRLLTPAADAVIAQLLTVARGIRG